MSEFEVFEESTSEEVDATPAAIFAAFELAIANDKDDDDIKLAMISAGATFKNVTRLYNQYMIETGRAVSKADRDLIINNALSGREFATEEEFTSACVALMEAMKCTDKSANSTIRAYCKKNEKPVYAAEKIGDGKTRNPFVKLFHEGLIANPNYTEQDLRDLIARLDPEDQTNPTRWFSQHNNIRIMVNNIAKRFQPI